ncbi:hypothetical protein HHK36_032835 [Tetracentron sinense]|uniref:Phytosulfokine n=1 Tax=Tetracentron sinense TaxID=13715 RepID=A0A835CZ67_TETSI|nr:hypothetical protein HHK36_032835 [Tetracentron sinense]
MAKIFIFIFLILALLILSCTASRPIPTNTTSPESDPQMVPALEESSVDGDECEGLESEECVMRKSMVDHTDYIYTQDVKGP